ncbi:MAG: glycosyltransferase [Spirochaetales bacterium]|nr:glycosyltransferase [Spirochaetales bacterium]
MERMARDSGVFTNSAIHRVPFGVDTVSYRPGDRFAVRERLGIPREAFVLLARASRSEFKGYPELDAMLGRAAWRNAVLLTVDGKNLFDHRKDRYLVMDQGWVLDDERMADLYRASDVFVMTSRAESFGMMAVEAMACGTPVVAFRNTALAELLDDGRTGVLVEDGDSAALLDGINRIKEDARYRAELIDAALLRVKAEYDFEAHFRAIREAYASAIARRANA